jgi:hypothetical protein
MEKVPHTGLMHTDTEELVECLVRLANAKEYPMKYTAFARINQLLSYGDIHDLESILDLRHIRIVNDELENLSK